VPDTPLSLQTPLGRVSISREAVAQIVGHTVAECYGVVGTAPAARAPARVRRLLARARPTLGIAVGGEGESLTLDLRVVVEHGLNLAEVAATIRSRVGYEVERLTGLQVASIGVHIEDVRQSA
jgi:uncharacterized alkaline shock family protein YloU